MIMKTQKLATCLWLDNQAEEVLEFYKHVFKNVEVIGAINNTEATPGGEPGTVLCIYFVLENMEFLAMNGGPEYKINPSISYMVNCASTDEVEYLWDKLSKGGTPLMPLDKYPFSEKYGWIQDRFGVSWQLIFTETQPLQKVRPSLMFTNEVCGKAEEAMGFYTSIFENAEIGTVNRYPAGMAPDKEGTIMFADFRLENQGFAVMDSAQDHKFTFNPAISIIINCETQQEVDYFWDKLKDGGSEMACGWLTDKYGIAWQVTPTILPKLLQGADKDRAGRVMLAMMDMVKLDIAKLEEA